MIVAQCQYGNGMYQYLFSGHRHLRNVGEHNFYRMDEKNVLHNSKEVNAFDKKSDLTGSVDLFEVFSNKIDFFNSIEN